MSALISLSVFINIEICSTTDPNSSTALECTNISYKTLMCANKPSDKCLGRGCPVGVLAVEKLQGPGQPALPARFVNKLLSLFLHEIVKHLLQHMPVFRRITLP